MSGKINTIDPQLDSINNDIHNQHLIIESKEHNQRLFETSFAIVLVIFIITLITFMFPYTYFVLLFESILLIKIHKDILKVRKEVAIEKGILIITQDLRHMFYDEKFRPTYLK